MKFIKQILSSIYRSWLSLFDNNKVDCFDKIGAGVHDCALVALHNVAPKVSQDKVIDAFTYCTADWPYGGVSNKEFNIVVKYLKLKFEYDDSDGQTIGELMQKKANKCVALIHGHYIAIEDGKVVGRDKIFYNESTTKVYCSWYFA